jgi:hypothetical protein
LRKRQYDDAIAVILKNGGKHHKSLFESQRPLKQAALRRGSTKSDLPII